MKYGMIFLFTIFGTVAANASAGEGVPHETIISQLFNLSILIVVLFFATRKTIAQAFADKKASYLNSVDQASKSKKDAQATLDEVKKRVFELSSTFDEQVTDAKKNAEESYNTQVTNAKTEAQRLKSMAKVSLDFEIQKQVESLRVETFKKSADMAEKNLEKNLTPEQLKAWNNHFVNAQQGAH